MPDLFPVCRGAFRKQPDTNTLFEQKADVPVDRCGIPAHGAFDENGVAAFAQPADERPVAHFCIGDKTRWMDCVQHKDVQPRDMVGDDQIAALTAHSPLPLGAGADVEDVQQLPAPCFQDAALFRLVQMRVENRQQHRIKKVQGEAAATEQAGQDMGRALIHKRCWSFPVVVIRGARQTGCCPVFSWPFFLQSRRPPRFRGAS